MATVESVQHPQNPAPPGRSSEGRGKMVRWFLILCLIFLVIAVVTLLQRRTEHQVLAQQTDRMAVPTVAVIHATSVEGDSALTLPGNINSYVNSPIYARTN